jgi:hypothetical protein
LAFGAAVYVTAFDVLGGLAAKLLGVHGPFTTYAPFYQSLLTGIIVFASIAYTVIQWKVTSKSDVVAEQARFYRTRYFDLAYELQTASSETLGVVGLKAIAEQLDMLSHTPETFDWATLNSRLQQVAQVPEIYQVPPLMLIGVPNLQQSYLRLQWWKAATSAALSWVVFSILCVLGFAVSPTFSSNAGGLVGAIVALILAVQSLGRFVTTPVSELAKVTETAPSSQSHTEPPGDSKITLHQ